MTAENEKMLEKVRKLLRLAEGAANQHESATAAAAAQKLIEAHRLDQAMLDVRNDRATVEEPVQRDPSPLDQSKTRIVWRSVLAQGLSVANNCQSINAARGGDILIIGNASNIATVRYLFAYFVRQIDLMASGYAGFGRAWIHAWRVGCADTIATRLKEAQSRLREEMLASQAGGGSALALVHAGIARVDAEKQAVTRYVEKNMELETIKSPRFTEVSGFIQGRLDGRSVELGSGPALGQGAKANIR